MRGKRMRQSHRYEIIYSDPTAPNFLMNGFIRRNTVEECKQAVEESGHIFKTAIYKGVVKEEE